MIAGITASVRRKVGGDIPRQVVMEWDGYYYGFRRNHTGGQWRQDTVQLSSPQPLWFYDRYGGDSEEIGTAYPIINHYSVFSGWGAGERSLGFYTGYVNFRWVFEEAWVVINGEHFNLLEGTITETEQYGQFTYELTLDPIDPSPILPDQDNFIEGRIVMNPRPEEPSLPTEIGEAFGGGFYAGDIQYPDGQWYKLIIADVSADITGTTARWKTINNDTPNTGHLIDGVANTNAMVAAGIELHPAAAHCINHRGGGFEDWYMPAKDELNVIYLNLGWNQPNCPPDWQIGGSQQFGGGYYWASTQGTPAYNGWAQAMGSGNASGQEKARTSNRVRPVRRIPFTP